MYRVIHKGYGEYAVQEKGWFFWHDINYYTTKEAATLQVERLKALPEKGAVVST